jgi:hypothetical protein
MTIINTVQRNQDEIDLMEMFNSENTHQTDDTWAEEVDDEDDEVGDLFDAAPGKARMPIVGWVKDALGALKPARYVGSGVVPAVKQWALVAKSTVMQYWGYWTGHEKPVVETREVLVKSGCVCVRKPVELSLHEKRLVKAKLVKRITSER